MEDVESDGEDKARVVPDYVKQEMQKFEQGFNGLQGKFKLLNKIGEGTFSSVYKAIDLEYDKYDNSDWDDLNDRSSASARGSTDPGESTKSMAITEKKSGAAEGGKVVAIKRIYVTSSPIRIENEVSILRDLSGHKNVVTLITAHRYKDQVILVLPYFEHAEFRSYYRNLPMEDIRCYFRALLSGLAHVHSKKIIHRDIKPSNFLYDPVRKTGILVDFGLAERQEEQSESTTPRIGSTKSSLMARGSLKRPFHLIAHFLCLRRPVARVNRAGTRGFRAPEILFRHVRQTVALDVWSVGAILIAFLTGRFPFFHSYDEADALIEIAILFGQVQMKRAAATFGRAMTASVCNEAKNGLDGENTGDESKRSSTSKKPAVVGWDSQKNLEEAVRLLRRLLTLNPEDRITAEETLRHPFLVEKQP
ncbi:MAG: serine/threonine protein kinase Hsk1 [Benniella sp.]|nr:MAG: serine/threonine protein kinase Hsk1 [Benniella sp.]